MFFDAKSTPMVLSRVDANPRLVYTSSKEVFPTPVDVFQRFQVSHYHDSITLFHLAAIPNHQQLDLSAGVRHTLYLFSSWFRNKPKNVISSQAPTLSDASRIPIFLCAMQFKSILQWRIVQAV